jgi:hypothetical protein
MGCLANFPHRRLLSIPVAELRLQGTHGSPFATHSRPGLMKVRFLSISRQLSTKPIQDSDPRAMRPWPVGSLQLVFYTLNRIHALAGSSFLPLARSIRQQVSQEKNP